MSDLLQKLGLSPAEVSRIAARTMRRGCYGRGGLPGSIITAMYADYQRLNSLSAVAKIYGRTRQAVWEIFKAHGLKMNTRTLKPKIEYRGRTFTTGKDGYYRESVNHSAGVRPLHRQIWEDMHGPVPVGHQVSFKDGDKTNLAPDNLFCAPIAEVSRYHYRRNFPERSQWTPEQRRAFWRKRSREWKRKHYAKQRSLKKVGLAVPGEPRKSQFHYFPPVIVREDSNTRTTRQTFKFKSARTQFDFAYEQIRAEMENPQS